MADDIVSAAGVIERPIHQPRTVQPVEAVSAGGGTACRRDLPELSSSAVPAHDKGFSAPIISDLSYQ